MTFEVNARRAISAAVLFVLIAFVLLVLAMPAQSATGTEHNRSAEPLTVGVIGDTPYGASQLAAFPADVAEINADPHTRLVLHLGDIKNGSSRCDDSYFDRIRSEFDGFADPLVYTPGDNEWTDCHRVNNGAYNPFERLAALRAKFFDEPGRTMGARARTVETQGAPYVENVSFTQSRTVFGMLHIVGSNNGLLPWSGLGILAPTPQQLAALEAREQAALDWIDAVFARASAADAAAVVLGMQADTWDAFAIAAGETSEFNAIVAKIAERSAEFGKPVLLLQGDSHQFVADRPLLSGSPAHGVTTAAPNVQRIVVQGSTSVPHEWLRLKINPRSASVFSWERVELGA